MQFLRSSSHKKIAPKRVTNRFKIKTGSSAPTLVSPVYLDYDLQEIETFSWTNNYDKNLGNLNFRLQVTDTFDFSSLIIDTLISSNKFSNENMFVNGKKYFLSPRGSKNSENWYRYKIIKPIRIKICI